MSHCDLDQRQPWVRVPASTAGQSTPVQITNCPVNPQLIGASKPCALHDVAPHVTAAY